VFYYPPGKIKSFRSNFPLYEIGRVDSIALFWQTGIGSSVSLNKTAVNENDTMIVSVRSDTVFTLRAVGEVTDSQTIHIKGIETGKYNRALLRTATASTTDWGFSPNAVNDGDSTTYWKSVSGKTQWISINFEKTISISNVKLQWGTVYATTYYFFLTKESGDAEAVYTTTTGDGGIDDISVSGVGRSLRILCLQNTTVNDPYILKEVEVYGTNISTSADGASVRSVPEEYSVEQNYPNPFNPSTVIGYRIPTTNIVSLKVYNILGEEIAILVNAEQEKGKHTVTFNASKLSSGIYFYTFRAGTFSKTSMMLLLK
jgi:hypothetical protein